MKSQIPALLAVLTASSLPLSQAQNVIAPNDGAWNDSYAAPAVKGAASQQNYANNFGQVGINSSAFFRYTTGDDIQGRSSTATGDVTSREYGLRFQGVVGDTANFSYTPTWQNYSGGRYSDEFNHRFTGNATFNTSGWDILFGQTYSDSSPINTETAQQTPEESWGTQLNGNYRLNSSLSAGLGATFNTRDSEGFNSTKSTIFQGFISQQLATDGILTLSVSKGSDDTNDGFNADLTQYSGRFGYQPSELLYVSAMIGNQKRSFNIVGAPDLSSTIYSFAANFTPAPFTEISIRSDSTLGASLFTNQTTENESLSVNLTQRLFDILSLSLSYGNEKSEYLNAVQSNQVIRSDDYDFFDARLSLDVRQNTAVSIFYRDQQNQSDDSFFGYDGSQHGIEARISF